jgi:predicted O-methyltransferase YrrM
LETLRVVEEALAEHAAWGDSEYILEQLDVTFRRRLDAVAEQMPVAGRLAAALEEADGSTRNAIAGNTVIRCAVQHAHLRVVGEQDYGLSLETSAKVLEVTVDRLERGESGTPFEAGEASLKQLSPGDDRGWIWSEDYPQGDFGAAFRSIIDLEYGDKLSSITESELVALRRGRELLLELMPKLAPSALAHTHLVGCFANEGFWRGKLSSSQIRAGGTIFLSREMLRDPWCIAEHLLHESLHQKLYDFRHGHQLMHPEVATSEPVRITALWNSPELDAANQWDTSRAFAAFHVYVHLSVLALVAEQVVDGLAATYGPPRGLIASRKALDRARYLGEQLDEVRGVALGPAGERLLDWLRDVLDIVDPEPPPRGATTHLLFDRYLREANRVEAVLSTGAGEPSPLSEQLQPVARQELAQAEEILSVIGKGARSMTLRAAASEFTDGELGTRFPWLRRSIAAEILEAAPSPWSLSTAPSIASEADTLVRQLVEYGSEQLSLIEARVPAAVAAAKRRARSVAFRQSCEDEVGRLLSALAAAVPSGGRILEIGTGVGVGLGWLVAGLEDREDVEVLTIESDERLAASAREGAWPDFVNLVVADATTVTFEGTYDLVFVDAAPVKYGRFVTVADAVRPGGFLVVDDLHAGPETTGRERAEKEALRRDLLGASYFHAVELTWSSGVILAVRSAGGTAPPGRDRTS